MPHSFKDQLLERDRKCNLQTSNDIQSRSFENSALEMSRATAICQKQITVVGPECVVSNH